MDPGEKFSTEVKAAMQKLGISQVQLAAKTGIRQENLSRLLSGNRGWKPVYIERVCRALKINPFRYLADEIMRVPLVGTLVEGAFTPEPNPKKMSRTLSAQIPANLDKAYSILVSDNSLAPFIKPGAYIYATNKPERIEDGDLVVYLDSEGVGRVYIFIHDPQTIHLRSMGSYPDRQLPAKYLAVLDRVIAVFWP